MLVGVALTLALALELELELPLAPGARARARAGAATGAARLRGARQRRPRPGWQVLSVDVAVAVADSELLGDALTVALPDDEDAEDALPDPLADELPLEDDDELLDPVLVLLRAAVDDRVAVDVAVDDSLPDALPVADAEPLGLLLSLGDDDDEPDCELDASGRHRGRCQDCVPDAVGGAVRVLLAVDDPDEGGGGRGRRRLAGGRGRRRGGRGSWRCRCCWRTSWSSTLGLSAATVADLDGVRDAGATRQPCCSAKRALRRRRGRGRALRRDGLHRAQRGAGAACRALCCPSPAWWMDGTAVTLRDAPKEPLAELVAGARGRRAAGARTRPGTRARA